MFVKILGNTRFRPEYRFLNHGVENLKFRVQVCSRGKTIQTVIRWLGYVDNNANGAVYFQIFSCVELMALVPGNTGKQGKHPKFQSIIIFPSAMTLNWSILSMFRQAHIETKDSEGGSWSRLCRPFKKIG